MRIWYEKHYRVHHGVNEFARGKNHISEIESFWLYAKHRLKKFHCWRKAAFCLHLKECEFRFNNRKKTCIKRCLKSSEKARLSRQAPNE